MRQLVPALLFVVAIGCNSSTSSSGGGGGAKTDMLIGVWESASLDGKEVKADEFVIEFLKDGRTIAEGEERTYKLVEDQLTVAKKDGSDSKTFKVKSLTDDKLVLTDPESKKEMEMKKKKK
jgi:hypothetical protein